MKIEVINTKNGRCMCRGPRCEKLPEYVSSGGCIKRNTLAAKITTYKVGYGPNNVGSYGYGTKDIYYYCRDCLDKLFVDVQIALDPNLWILK